MKDLVILGAGGFAREVAWLVEDINAQGEQWRLLGFIDESSANHGKDLNGYPVLGDFSWLRGRSGLHGVCAVGNTEAKRALVAKGAEAGLAWATLIHPSVMMSSHGSVGKGSVLCAGNILTTNFTLGRHVILNLDCTVGHDAVIGDYATILPSVNISGCTTIGEGCFFGTGGGIINDTAIGPWAVIGAGAMVVKDLPGRCTAVGVPAKVIKQR